MKLNLLSMLKMIEEEDKKLEENKLPLVQKEQKTALDLQGLFSLFEEIEPTINVFREDETENLEGFKNVEMTLKVPRAHLTSKMGNRGTEDYRYFAQLIRGLTGGNPTPVEVFKKIEKLQTVLLKGTDKNLSISQNVSAMILMEAIYSFFNGFYTIGGGGDKGEDNVKAGTRLGFFAESLAVALYGAVGTIPHGFASGTLYSLVDFFDPSGEQPIPVSLKTTKKLLKAGAKFYLLHDLVKYGKIYVDVLEKSESGSGNIYTVIYKRHEIMLDSYNERASDLERRCIEELKRIYEPFSKNQNSSENVPMNENENTITEDEAEGFTFEPEPNQRGLSVPGLNLLENKIFLLSLHYSNQIERFKKYWNELSNYYPRRPAGGAQAKFLNLEEKEAKLSPTEIKILRAKLLGREFSKGGIFVSYGNLIDSIALNNKLKTQKQLENEISYELKNNDRKMFFLLRNEKRSPILKYVLGEMNKRIDTKIREPSLDNTKPGFPIVVKPPLQPASAQSAATEPEAAGQPQAQAEPAAGQQSSTQQPETPSEEDVEKEKMLNIFKNQYGDQGGKLSINIRNSVKEVYDNHSNLGNFDYRDLPQPDTTVKLTLDPESLKTIFKNANDSLEKNYRMLVTRLNSLSILMNRYFLSPTPSAEDGKSLKNAAKTLGIRTEKAVDKNQPKD